MFSRLRNGLSGSASTVSGPSTPSSSSSSTISSQEEKKSKEQAILAQKALTRKKAFSKNSDAYLLLVTAGPSKDTSTHVPICPNDESETKFVKRLKNGMEVKVGLRVLIRDHPGTYESSKKAKAYFGSEQHKEDKYSIQFSIELPGRWGKEDGKKEGERKGEEEGEETEEGEQGYGEINTKDLLWGNDFDEPIRYNLPVGFGTALKFVKWVLDPGIIEDVYADEPYLFGPALSSVNYINISSKAKTDDKEKEKPETFVIEEDMTSSSPSSSSDDTTKQQNGDTATSITIPSDPTKRRKYFLNPKNRENVSITPGKIFKMDFCNGFVDFNTFSLALPHFKLNILRFWDGQPLRYVLKYKNEGGEEDVLFALQFMLVPAKGAGDKEEERPEGAEAVSSEDAASEEVDVVELENEVRSRTLDEEGWREVQQKMADVKVETSRERRGEAD